MKTFFHLGSCSTCQRIINELDLGTTEVQLQEIKSEPVTEAQIDAMKERAGSYEALFSRRALKYRAMGLGDKNLSEPDYRQLILDEYTFLKRPVLILDDEIFVGNSKKVTAAAKAALR